MPKLSNNTKFQNPIENEDLPQSLNEIEVVPEVLNPSQEASEIPQNAPKKFYEQTCIYFRRLKRRRELNNYAKTIKLDCFSITSGSDSEEPIIDDK